MTRGTIDSGPGNGAFSLVKKKGKKAERNFKLVYKALFFLSFSHRGLFAPISCPENWILSMLLRVTIVQQVVVKNN